MSDSWQWEGDDEWRDFDPSVAAVLSAAQTCTGAVVKRLTLTIHGHDYEIDLEDMTQVRKSTGATRKIRRGTSSPKCSFTLCSWNVLAHKHTGWFATKHGGLPKARETVAQRDVRNALVIRRLQELSPDVALLQEVDETLLPPHWEPGTTLPCGVSLEGYTPYRNYREYQGSREGTAVLLKDAVFKGSKSIRLEPTEAHGWKTGIVVQAVGVGPLADLGRIAFASVHLRGHGSGKSDAQLWLDAGVRRELLTSTVTAMGDARCRVLSGDFNTKAAHLECTGIEPLLAGSGLSKQPLPSGLPTCIESGAYEPANVIDHVYTSAPAVTPKGAVKVGTLPPDGDLCALWGAPLHHDGSDHAWLHVELAVEPASL